MVCEVARARAPALTVNPSSGWPRSMRSRVSREIVRLPESAYETVLRETPAARATSSIVAMSIRSSSNRFEFELISSCLLSQRDVVERT